MHRTQETITRNEVMVSEEGSIARAMAIAANRIAMARAIAPTRAMA